jgi:hypothetical protein
VISSKHIWTFSIVGESLPNDALWPPPTGFRPEGDGPIILNSPTPYAGSARFPVSSRLLPQKLPGGTSAAAVDVLAARFLRLAQSALI